MRFLLFTFFATFLFADSIIIVNPANPQLSISTDEVEKIYVNKKSAWNHGGKIILGVLKSGEFHEDFMKKIVKKSPDKFTKFWKQLAFSGQGQLPKSFATESELMEFVAKNENAIGYITDKTPLSGVKSLSWK